MLLSLADKCYELDAATWLKQSFHGWGSRCMMSGNMSVMGRQPGASLRIECCSSTVLMAEGVDAS